MGVTPPPLNGKPPKHFRNFFPERAKRLKMDKKGHIIDQKELKMYEKAN